MKTAPIGLFYGSSTCYTEIAAEKIQQQFPNDCVTLHNVADTPLANMVHYQQLILGIPTWDYGELQEDWENAWDDLDTLDLSATTIALYGLGDQVGYPDWFLDAMGYLHNKVIVQGAKVIGYWPNEGYEYNESQALTEDKREFFGLALDDENEFDKTDQRIQQWCDELKQHFSCEE
jgi:flavodoxin II